MTARSLKLFIIIALFSVVACAVPEGTVHAQQLGKLIPCEGNGCNTCELVTLGNNLLKFIIVLSTLFATIMFVWAGFLFVTAGGNQATVKKAKGIFLNVFIGFVIVLTGFLIVDTVMRLLVGDNLLGGGPWTSIDCSRSPNPIPTTPGPWTGSSGGTGGVTVGGGGGGGGGVDTPGGPTLSASEARTTLDEAGIPVQSSVNLDGVNASMTSTLVEVKNESGMNLVVTSARDGTHQNSCHSQGTCFDVVCTSCGNNPALLQGFITNTQSRGYCAVYEPGPSGACPAGVSPCLPGVGTGAHFSFYMNSSQSGSCRL